MEIRTIKSEDIRPISTRGYYDHCSRSISALYFRQLPDTMLPVQRGDILDIEVSGSIPCRVSVIEVEGNSVLAVVWLPPLDQ